MNVELPNEFRDFVKDLVARGRFGTEQDAIVEGIRLLMNRESLRREVRQGIGQLNAGKSLDEDSVFAEVAAAIDAVELEQEGK